MLPTQWLPVPLIQYHYLSWCTKIRAVLTGPMTVSGFDLAWFSSLVFQAPLCLRSSWCYICSKNFFCLHPSLYLLVSWAWWDWPLTWLTNCRPSVLWHCWLGHVTRKTVSEMTYNVLSGTLNSTIPYHTFSTITELAHIINASIHS